MIKKTLQKYYNGGFTLVELMVTMVISSLVMAGIFGVYRIQQKSYTVQEQVSELQLKGRSALDFMARDIRMAAYDDADNNCTSGKISKATHQEFSFETCNAGGEQVAVTYNLDAYKYGSGDNDTWIDDLFRVEDNGTDPPETELLLEGVDGFEFFYFKKDGTPLDSPVALGELDDIRTVQISMLVRSTYPDPKYTDSVTYKPGSELAGTPASSWLRNGLANPPDDNYYRRLFITSVQLRNM